jgi:hypothetical protein
VALIATEPEVTRKYVPGDGDDLARVERTIPRLREDRDLGVIDEQSYREQIMPPVARHDAPKVQGTQAGRWVKTLRAGHRRGGRSATGSEDERRNLAP